MQKKVYLSSIGALITHYRELASMSMEELEKRSQSLKGAVKSYEANRMVPSLRMLRAIALVLNFTEEDYAAARELRITSSKKYSWKPPVLTGQWSFTNLPYLVCTADGKKPTCMQLKRALYEFYRKRNEPQLHAPEAICQDPSLRHPAVTEPERVASDS